eukprot:scaffold4494_cov161-Amphora_coffeaeformis.AAC.13
MDLFNTYDAVPMVWSLFSFSIPENRNVGFLFAESGKMNGMSVIPSSNGELRNAVWQFCRTAWQSTTAQAELRNAVWQFCLSAKRSSLT